jgi:hypothetical protein
MSAPTTTLDFKALAGLGNDGLERLLQAGAPITTAEVAGYEYRGWNMNAATTLTGTRKSKKGFYRDPVNRGYWGYNVRVKPGTIDDPWVAVPSEAEPTDPKTGQAAKPIPLKEPQYPPGYLATKYKVCIVGSGAGGRWRQPAWRKPRSAPFWSWRLASGSAPKVIHDSGTT